MSDEVTRRMETFSLVGTEAQLDKFKSDMAKVGWKLRVVGNSGTWLGESILEITKEPGFTNGIPDADVI